MGNPLAVAFLVLALVMLALTVGLMLFQRRIFRQQSNEVRELLAEARKMAQEDAAARQGAEPEDAPPGGEDRPEQR